MMKFIITESQKESLDKFIYNYIDRLITDEPYVEFWELDGFGEEVDNDTYNEETISCSVYSNDEMEEPLFRIYFLKYWEVYSERGELIPGFKKPIHNLLQLDYGLEELNDVFNDSWHEPLKQWIKDNIRQLDGIDFEIDD